MASAAPRTPFEVRRRVLGFREVQIVAMLEQRRSLGLLVPSYAEIMQELGFCDKAGVLRVIERLERKQIVTRSGGGRRRRLSLNNN